MLKGSNVKFLCVGLSLAACGPKDATRRQEPANVAVAKLPERRASVVAVRPQVDSTQFTLADTTPIAALLDSLTSLKADQYESTSQFGERSRALLDSGSTFAVPVLLSDTSDFMSRPHISYDADKQELNISIPFNSLGLGGNGPLPFVLAKRDSIGGSVGGRTAVVSEFANIAPAQRRKDLKSNLTFAISRDKARTLVPNIVCVLVLTPAPGWAGALAQATPIHLTSGNFEFSGRSRTLYVAEASMLLVDRATGSVVFRSKM